MTEGHSNPFEQLLSTGERIGGCWTNSGIRMITSMSGDPASERVRNRCSTRWSYCVTAWRRDAMPYLSPARCITHKSFATSRADVVTNTRIDSRERSVRDTREVCVEKEDDR